MQHATREDFQKRAARRFKTIELPDLGKVTIRSLNTREYYRLSDQIGQVGQGDFLAPACLKMIACVVSEPDHQPMFADDDLETLKDLDSDVMIPLVTAINDHIGAETKESAKKNSIETPSEPSP